MLVYCTPVVGIEVVPVTSTKKQRERNTDVSQLPHVAVVFLVQGRRKWIMLNLNLLLESNRCLNANDKAFEGNEMLGMNDNASS